MSYTKIQTTNIHIYLTFINEFETDWKLILFKGGAVLTLAYSPENEAGGIQLVGQGNLGEGTFIISMENHKTIMY